MSPSYMNQRRFGEDSTTIPKGIAVAPTVESDGGEHLAFDKAEEAERKEKEKRQLVKEIETLEASLKEAAEEEKTRIRDEIESARERLRKLAESESQSDSNVDPAEPGQGDDG